MPSRAASVVICVYNREHQILPCLESLAAMDFNNFEIIAVDDGSTDRSLEQLKTFQQNHPEIPLKILRNASNLGVSATRNVGLKAACGQFVAFTDSDCIVHHEWLTALTEAFDAPDVASVSGTVYDASPRNLAERAYVGTCRVGLEGMQNRPLIGNNMAFRSEIVRDFLFDSSLTYGCDEDELAWRLRLRGYRSRFAKRAIAYHDHAMGLRGYLDMASRQGVGSARFWYKRGTYLGRDLIFLFAAAATLPLGFIDSRLLAVSAIFLTLQFAAMLYNEIALKGKPLAEAIIVLPYCFLFNLVKSRSVVVTLWRIMTRRETTIIRSKQRWLEAIAE